MTWEQKFAALTSLSEASIKQDSYGKWYVSHPHVERKEGGCLSSGGGGHADTIEKAVDNYWGWITCSSYYVIVDAFNKRRAVQWNGFMWKDVIE